MYLRTSDLLKRFLSMMQSNVHASSYRWSSTFMKRPAGPTFLDPGPTGSRPDKRFVSFRDQRVQLFWARTRTLVTLTSWAQTRVSGPGLDGPAGLYFYAILKKSKLFFHTQRCSMFIRQVTVCHRIFLFF